MTQLSSIGERIAEQRLRAIGKELGRTWLQVFVVNVFFAALVAKGSPFVYAAAWLALIEASQYARRKIVSQAFERANPRFSLISLEAFVRWSFILGAIRALALAMIAVAGDASAWYFASLAMAGLAVGAVVTSGGDRRAFFAWCVLPFFVVAAGWIGQHTWEGYAVAALTVVILPIIGRHIDQLGDSGAQLIAQSFELEKQRDRAKRIDEAKTRVLASVSHDLRQPLFALSLHVTALADYQIKAGESHLGRIVDGLQRSLDQCKNLMDQLVDFSRIEAGVVDIKSHNVNLIELIESNKAQYLALAQQYGVKWRIEILCDKAEGWCDPILMCRILDNLVVNAVKFAPHGEAGLNLRMLDSGRCQIEIFDSGPGIPEHERENVFEAFYQIENPSRQRSRGLGLGLSIVKRLADLMCLEISIQSRLGEGTSFIVSIPVEGVHLTRLSEAGGGNQSTSDGTENRLPKSVLIVDDEPDILTALDHCLTARGCAVFTASDVEAACAIARTEPDLGALLVDFRLGRGISGAEAIRAICDARGGRRLATVIMTGDTAPARIEAANSTGLTVIHKPVDGHRVCEAICSAVTNFQLEEARSPN